MARLPSQLKLPVRLFAFLALAAFLASVVFGPGTGRLLGSTAVEIAAEHIGVDGSIDDVHRIVERVAQDDAPELAEGDDDDDDDDESWHVVTRSHPDRRPERVRARGPPVLDGWARLQLSQAPRGPPYV